MIRVGNHVCRVPYHLVIQAPDTHSTLDYGSQIPRFVIGIARSDTNHATANGGHRPRDQRQVHASSSALHSIQRQLGSNRACVATEDMAPDKTHQ